MTSKILFIRWANIGYIDGRAIHIERALGTPIVTIWGSTGPDRWRP